MSKSYAQILQQIESLKAEAEAARRKEIEGVVARIKEAIEVYGLTAADLGFAEGPRATSTTGRRGTTAARQRANKAGGADERPVRYRDEAGNTWGGRGPRPRWLRNALAAGKTLQDLEV
jgi:DNA-binding protein H-NS